MAKAGRLYEKTNDYLEKVSGPRKQYAMAALLRLSEQRYQDLPDFGRNFEKKMIDRLKANHPQKCDYAGAPALRTLISRGAETAEQRLISTGQGTAFLICLMFAFGHGCATDPHLPWIESTLINAAISDPNKGVERLYSKTMTYLKHVLASRGISS